MSDGQHTTDGWLYAVVDVADNSTTVYAEECQVRKAWVNTALSAHALPIQDGSTAIRSFAASAALNAELDFGDCTVSSLVVDPNDAATGNITIVYRPTGGR